MEGKFEEPKCYFNAKMSEQEENLTKVFNNVLILENRSLNKFKVKLKVCASIWNLKAEC